MSIQSTPRKDTTQVRDTLASIRSMLEYNNPTGVAANTSRFRQRPLFTFAAGGEGVAAAAGGGGINNGTFSRMPQAGSLGGGGGSFNRSPSTGGNSISGNPNGYRSSPARSGTPSSGGVSSAYLLQSQRELERTQREKHDAERRCMELETQLIEAQTQVERLMMGLPSGAGAEENELYHQPIDEQTADPTNTNNNQPRGNVSSTSGTAAVGTSATPPQQTPTPRSSIVVDDSELMYATAKAIAAIHSVYGPAAQSKRSGSKTSSAGSSPYGSLNGVSESSPSSSLAGLPSAESSPSVVLAYLVERIGDLDSALDRQQSLEAERARLIQSQQANAVRVQEMIEEVEASEAEKQKEIATLIADATNKENNFKKLLAERQQQIAQLEDRILKFDGQLPSVEREMTAYKKRCEELEVTLEAEKAQSRKETQLLQEQLTTLTRKLATEEQRHSEEMDKLESEYEAKMSSLEERCRQAVDSAHETASNKMSAESTQSAPEIPSNVLGQFTDMVNRVEELTRQLQEKTKSSVNSSAIHNGSNHEENIKALTEAMAEVARRTEKNQKASTEELNAVAEQLSVWQEALTLRQAKLVEAESNLAVRERSLAKQEGEFAERASVTPTSSNVENIDEAKMRATDNSKVTLLQSDLSQAREKITELEDEYKHLSEEMQVTTFRLEEKENRITDLEAALEAKLITFRTTEEGLNAELNNAEETIQQLEESNKKLTADLAHLQQELAATIATSDAKKKAKDEQSAVLLEELELELEHKIEHIQELQSRLASITDETEMRMKELTITHKNDIEALERQLKAHEAMIATLEERAAVAEDEASAAKTAAMESQAGNTTTKTHVSDQAASSYASYSPEPNHLSEGMELTQRALESLSTDYEALSEAYDRVVELLNGLGIDFSPYKRTSEDEDANEGSNREDSGERTDHGSEEAGTASFASSPSRGRFDSSVHPAVTDNDPLYMPRWSLLQVMSRKDGASATPMTVSVEVKRFTASAPNRAGGWPSSSEVIGSARPVFDDSLPDLAPTISIPVEELWSTTFDAFSWQVKAKGNLMVSVAMAAFKELDIPQNLVEQTTFHRYATVLQRGYKDDNAYHSSTHAADVAQFFVTTLKLTGLLEVLAPVDRLACLVAALAHDFEHPGRNNDYLNKMRDPISVRYGGLKVLEAHHAAAALELLQHPLLDITAKFEPAAITKFRTIVTGLVYTTDMATHFEHLQSYSERLAKNALVQQNQSVNSTASNLLFDDKTSDADRLLTLQMLMHMIDIGNVARPSPIADRWSAAIREENWSQGDDEKKSNLAIASPMFDRNVPANPNNTFFIDVFALPLAKILAFRFPSLQPLVDQIVRNRTSMILAGSGGKDLTPEQEAIAKTASAAFDPQECLRVAYKKYASTLPAGIIPPTDVEGTANKGGVSPKKSAEEEKTSSKQSSSPSDTEKTLLELVKVTQARVSELIKEKDQLMADLEEAATFIEEHIKH